MGNIIALLLRLETPDMDGGVKLEKIPGKGSGEFCDDEHFYMVRNESLGSVLSAAGCAESDWDDEEDEVELPPLFDA